MANKKIEVQGIQVRLITQAKSEYICITDIAKKFNDVPADIIKAWMRNRNTVDFLGTWEQFHNDDFKMVEFDHIKNQTGSSTFILTVKNWIESTNSIGMTAKSGRFGGTYAHSDIALEFCSYLSPAFKLYFLKEFQRLKTEEAKSLQSEWNVRRLIAKTNYHIHSESVRENLVPSLTGTLNANPFTTPLKPTFLIWRYSASPPANGNKPTPKPKGICATTLPSSNYSCSPI